MRRAAKVDANQAAIVGAMRACGAKVQSLAAIGGGVPDLLVLHRGVLRLVEVKDGSRPASRRKLTPAQLEWHKDWPVQIVKDVEEAVALMAGRC